MRNTAITSQEIDTLYEARGEADCDKSLGDAVTWKEQAKFFAIMGKDRKEYLAKQRELLNEELERL